MVGVCHEVAQRVERMAGNHDVGGSSPLFRKNSQKKKETVLVFSFLEIIGIENSFGR